MKLLTALIILAPGFAFANSERCRPVYSKPCTPDKARKANILEHSEKGVEAYNRWKDARSEEARYRNDLIVERKLRDELGKGSMSDSEFDDLISRWTNAYEGMADRRQEAESELNAAVSLVIKEYQIDRVPKGLITGGSAKGLKPETTSKVHFPEEDFREVFIDSDGKTVYLYRHAAEMRFAGECSPFGGDAESGTAWNFDRWGSAPPIDSGGPVPYSHRPNSSRNAA